MGHIAHRHFVPTGELIFNINEIVAIIETKIAPPIAYFTLDDTPNSPISNITGVWTGTPTYTTSPIGKSATFDGTSHYITLDKENLFDFDVGDAFSLVFWIKQSITGAADGLICKTNTRQAGVGWSISSRSADDKLRFNIEDASQNGIDVRESTTVLSGNIWRHVIVVKAAGTDASTVSFFINGKAGTAVIINNSFVGSALNDLPVVIGAESDGGNGFTGDLDDVAIFDYALTADQARAIYMSSAGHALSNPARLLAILKNIVTSTIALIETKVNPPIAHFTFDDTEDSPINNITGTWTGAPVYTASPIGKSATLDQTKYITMDKEGLFDFEHTDPFSASFWCKFDSSASETFPINVSKGNGYNTIGWFIGTERSTNDRVTFQIHDGTLQFAITSGIGSLSDDVWEHIICTFSGNSNRSGMKIYLNGVLQTTGTSNAMSDTVLNNIDLRIGADGAATNFFKGEMDDVAIFDYELTATDVSAIFISASGHALSNPRRLLGKIKNISTTTVGLISTINLGIRKTISDIVGIDEVRNRLRNLVRTVTTSIVGLVGVVNLGLRKTAALSTIEITEASEKVTGIIRNTTTSILGIIELSNLGLRKTISSIINITESKNRLRDLIRNFTNIVGLTESVNLGIRKTISDIIDLIESKQNIAGIIRQIDDILGITEASNRAINLLRNITTDVVLLSELALAGFSLKEILGDIVGITEGIFLGKRRTVSDILNIIETPNLGLRKTVSNIVALIQSQNNAANWVRFANDIIGLVETPQRVFVGIIKESINLFNRGKNIILPTRGGNVILSNRSNLNTPSLVSNKSISLQSRGKNVNLLKRSITAKLANRLKKVSLSDRGKDINLSNRKKDIKLEDRKKSPKLYNRRKDVDSMVDNE